MVLSRGVDGPVRTTVQRRAGRGWRHRPPTDRAARRPGGGARRACRPTATCMQHRMPTTMHMSVASPQKAQQPPAAALGLVPYEGRDGAQHRCAQHLAIQSGSQHSRSSAATMRPGAMMAKTCSMYGRSSSCTSLSVGCSSSMIHPNIFCRKLSAASKRALSLSVLGIATNPLSLGNGLQFVSTHSAVVVMVGAPGSRPGARQELAAQKAQAGAPLSSAGGFKVSEGGIPSVASSPLGPYCCPLSQIAPRKR